MTDKPAAIDSKSYLLPFYGILNKKGDFWTALAFESRAEADAYLRDWVAQSGEQFRSMLTTHRIVPVRVRLNQLQETTDD